MAIAPDQVFRGPASQLPPPTPAERELVARAETRRIALMGDQQLLRQRYEEVMRWLNPPWDPISRRPDPRQEAATMERAGENLLHVDLANPSVDRWAVLQMGAAPIFKVRPTYVPPPVEDPDDPDKTTYDRKQYNIDRAMAQLQSSQMESQTQEWGEFADLHRTLFWAAWCQEAFGKAIVKSGWDPDADRPTAELYENPSAVYYGWSKRYGNRQLAWAMVVDEMAPEEANARYNLRLPVTSVGSLDVATWTGLQDQGDMDQRPEAQQSVQAFVNVEEYWELHYDEAGKADGVMFALILAGRVIDGPTHYPWKRLPFHVFESQHIPTWPHGKSTAEVVIPINAALDDMWDRQHDVIQFEAGPRYKGLNMANSGDEVDIPDAFHMIPLREGEDIAQIDTRVDFFPTELHSNQMYEGLHRSTGLTPIAWGMSPNAQTSGRAMSAEWRAVELPLTARLINSTPPVKEIWLSWWDYAEAYREDAKRVCKGYRAFSVIWVPLDIRDKTEKTADVINRVQANLLDPETAIEETGYENSDEIVARIRAYLVDPVWNPLRYQQYLTLQQLELSIRQQQLQVSQMEQEAAAAQQAPAAQPGQTGSPAPDQLAQQGANAAGQAAQGVNPATESTNQPGQMPGSGLPVDTSILSQTPLEGGIGNRAIVNPAGGPVPTSGQQPQ
jgi:hypothetical protein